MTTPSHQRVAGLGCYSTVVASVAAHHDVPLESPGLAPAVLHQPVVFARVNTVANSQHAMVEVSLTAEPVVVHTAGVQLEGLVVSVNGHRDGPNLSHCSLQGALVLGLHVHEAGEVGANIGGLEGAGAV